MKFLQNDVPVRWYLGHMFLRGKTITITDKFTIAKLSGDPSFVRVKEVQDEAQTQGQQTAPPAGPVLDGKGVRAMCPKCGKKPNYYFHVKNCQG